MVTIIGLVTIVTLIWLLAWAMTSASSAAAPTHSDIVPERQTRRAA